MAIPTIYRGVRVTRGDATGAQLALLVPTDYRVLHFASAADENVDWNVANPTHPTLYVHSETTPATDYIAFSHDGTDGLIDSVGATLRLNGITNVLLSIGGTNEITLTATAISPTTNDGNALGTGTLMWADLFLASGGVVNFNNGDVTLTHATNLLTMAGGNLIVRGTNSLVSTLTAANITTAGAVTYSAAQLLGGRITRNPNGAARTDTTATAALLVAEVTGAAVGDSFWCVIENTATAAEAITLAAGTGVTLERLDGTGATIAQNGTAILLFVFTNVTGASEAVSVYVIAS